MVIKRDIHDNIRENAYKANFKALESCCLAIIGFYKTWKSRCSLG